MPTYTDFNKKLLSHNLFDTNNDFRRLIHVRIEPTEVCNFQCKFCMTQDPDRLSSIKAKGYDASNRKFDLDRILSLLDELKSVGVEAISIVAVGEPLVYPGIDKVIDKAVKLGFKLGLTSNFSMAIKDDLLNNLLKFSWLRWSLNAGTNLTYQNTNNPKGKIRETAFEKSCENISKLVSLKKEKKSSCEINASYVISQWNYFDVVNASKLCSELEIDSIFFRPDMLLIKDRSDTPHFILKENEENLKKARKYQNNNFSVHYDVERDNDNLITNNPNLVCFYSNHSIYIAANGDVYPCCYTRIDKKYVIGNIVDKKFDVFWKEEKNANHYKDLNVNLCPSCPYNELNTVLDKIYKGENYNRDDVPKSKDYFV